MDHNLQLRADELIRTLGQLGLAQESNPESAEVTALNRHAILLHESLVQANTDA